MIPVICIDDGGGMLFLGRRLSRDGTVYDDMIKISGGNICALPFSAKLLAGRDVRIIDRLRDCGEDDFLFIEDRDPSELDFERIVVYRWNRAYPHDRVCGIDFDSLEKISSEDFEGSSHERITREIYARKKT